MWTRRNMQMMRRIVLRRKTDPKIKGTTKRACAVEMHVNMSQKPPPKINIFTKNAAPLQIEARARTHSLREPGQIHFNILQESLHREITGKMLCPKAAAHTLREPAQLKCIAAFHKSHFLRNLQVKGRRQE